MRVHLLLLTLSMACYSEQGAKVYNSIPEVQITSHPEKVDVNEMETIIFMAQVSDANHSNSDLEISWLVNEETVCDWSTPEASGLSTCEIQLVEGNERISALARDPQGAAGTDIVEVQVILSTPPDVNLLSPLSEQRYYSDTQISFDAQLSDIDEPVQDLLVEWKSSIDGVLTLPDSIDSSGLFQGATLLSEGEHYIELTVTDRANKSTTRTQLIEVGPPNQTPECSFDTPTDGIGISKGSSITFAGTAFDAETPSEELIVRWISDIDGVFGESYADSSGNISYNHQGLAVGAHTVTLHVEDDAGAVCSHNLMVHVGTPPQLTIDSPAPQAVVPFGEPLLIEGSVIDNEDPAENIVFDWSSDVDGLLSNSGADSSGNISFSTAPLSAGTHNIHVTATDPIGLFTSTTINILVNQVPSAPVVDLTPQPADASQDLSVLASGSIDPEGSSVSYHYSWYTDNNLTSFTSATISNLETSKGELWTVRVTPNDGYHDGPYTESSIIISNTAPQADTLTVSPSNAYNTDILTCSGTSSDIDGDTITESYLWRHGALELATGSSIDLNQHSISPGDTITCVFVLDDGTDQSEHTQSITIDNHAPTIQSITLMPAPAHNDSTMTCTTQATDLDGDTLTYSYTWTNDTNGQVIGLQETLVLDASLASSLEDVRCTASVTDVSGASDTSSQSITLDNRSPIINDIAFLPNDLQMNTTIDCDVDAEDPDVDSITYDYEWSNISSGDIIGTAQSLTLNFSMGTGGDEIACTTTVTDQHGQSATASTQGLINRTKPEFDSPASIVPISVDTNSFVTCSASASDPDGTTVSLSYEWFNLSTGTFLGSQDSLQLTPFQISPTDDVQCIVTATDADQETETSSITTNVINTPPALSNIVITPSSTINEDLLTCSVSVFDADGETLTPSFIWYNSSAPIGLGDTLQLDSTLALPGDSIRCEANATDSYGGSTTTDLTVAIDNRPPSVDSMSIQSTTLYNDSTFTCNATYSDPDGEATTPSYEWQNTTTGLTIGTSDAITLNSSMAAPQDVITCTFTVTDDFGDTATAQSMLTLENRAPNTPVITLSPSTLYIDSTISCDVSATDPDQDTLQHTYSWTKNGVAIAPTTQSLSASIFAVGDSFSCQVIISDGIDSASASSPSHSIENKPPAIEGLVFDRTELYTNDTLTTSYSLSDADGDSVSYTHTWSVNGTAVQTGTQSTLDGLSFFEKGDVVTLLVEAEDGINPTQSQSIDIECLNSLPSGHTVSMPNHVVQGESDLTCIVDSLATDDDGDSLFYQFSWSVDGVVFTQANDFAAESVVDTNELNPEEQWICSVDVLDNDGTGSNANATSKVVAPWTAQRTFTNCGAEGYEGPTTTLCDTEYSSEALADEVRVLNGAQTWVVPQDGLYIIEATGAAGGSTSLSNGGLGAYMSGEFNLSYEDVLTIFVGQIGTDSQEGGAGGGGGSFVLLNGSPILVAGGGGGAMQLGAKYQNGLPASITTEGMSGTTGLYGSGPAGGQSGYAGEASDGSGGAGLLEDGMGIYGGFSLDNGLLGGNTQFSGGFGGGAGSNSGISGGGGGGYSGGGGGNVGSNLGVGGGGGSINLGANPVDLPELGIDGSVTIDRIP